MKRILVKPGVVAKFVVKVFIYLLCSYYLLCLDIEIVNVVKKNLRRAVVTEILF